METIYRATSQIQKAWNLYRLLERRDFQTGEHSYHVACMARNMSSYVRGHFGKEKLFIAGLLHDIGKIEFPDYLFENYKISTEEDYKIIRKHPVYSMKILEGCGFDKDIVQVAYTHHERCNGKGYPQGLKENKISIESRMIAILDSFSAITKERPYKKGVDDVNEALYILMKYPDQYDLDTLSIFRNNITSIMNNGIYINEKNNWL